MMLMLNVLIVVNILSNVFVSSHAAEIVPGIFSSSLADGKWADTAEKLFIGRRWFNGQQYPSQIIGTGPLNANNYCQQTFGTSLATITSQSDKDVFDHLLHGLSKLDPQRHIGLCECGWIGAQYDSNDQQYEYMKDNTVLQFEAWLNPSEKAKNQCILSYDKKWRGWSCQNNNNFIICDHPDRPAYELILRHKDISAGLFKADLSSTGIENPTSPEANTYSIIGNLNKADYVNDDGNYHFKLVYGYSDGSTDTLIWGQSSWPSEQGSVSGYTPILIPPENSATHEYKFGGLGLNTHYSQCTWLDGNKKSDETDHTGYYNSVGVMSFCYYSKSGIPAFDLKTADSYSLYIEVPDKKCSEVDVCPDSSTWMLQGARSGTGTLNNCEISGAPITNTNHYGYITSWYGSSRTVMSADYTDFTLSAEFQFNKIVSSWASEGKLIFRMKNYCELGGCTYGQQMTAYYASLNSAGQFRLVARTSGDSNGLAAVNVGALVPNGQYPYSSPIKFTISVTCIGDDITAKLFYNNQEYTISHKLDPQMTIPNMYGGGERSAYYTSGSIGFQIAVSDMTIRNIKLCDDTPSSAAKSPQLIQIPYEENEPNDNYYYFNISQSTLMFGAGILVILIIVNIIMMYVHCSNNKKRGYSKVKYADTDTEFVDSEANLVS